MDAAWRSLPVTRVRLFLVIPVRLFLVIPVLDTGIHSLKNRVQMDAASSAA